MPTNTTGGLNHSSRYRFTGILSTISEVHNQLFPNVSEPLVFYYSQGDYEDFWRLSNSTITGEICFDDSAMRDFLSRGLIEEIVNPPEFNLIRGRLEWDNTESPNPRVIFIPDPAGKYQIVSDRIIQQANSMVSTLEWHKPEVINSEMIARYGSENLLKFFEGLGQIPITENVYEHYQPLESKSLETLEHLAGAEHFDEPLQEGEEIRQVKIVPDEAQAAYLESLQETKAAGPIPLPEQEEDFWDEKENEQNKAEREKPKIETGHLTAMNDFIATPESRANMIRDRVSRENWRAWEGTPRPIEEILKYCGAGEVHITDGKRTFLAYRYFNGTRESAELIWHAKPEYSQMVPLTDEPELNIYKLKWPLLQTDAYIFPGSWLIQESSEAGWELYTPERALEIFGLYFIQNAQ
jgi:hypothetical protein